MFKQRAQIGSLDLQREEDFAPHGRGWEAHRGRYHGVKNSDEATELALEWWKNDPRCAQEKMSVSPGSPYTPTESEKGRTARTFGYRVHKNRVQKSAGSLRRPERLLSTLSRDTFATSNSTLTRSNLRVWVSCLGGLSESEAEAFFAANCAIGAGSFPRDDSSAIDRTVCCAYI